MPYHIEILGIDCNQEVFIDVARLTLDEPTEIIFESIHDEKMFPHFLRPISSSRGNVASTPT